MTLVGFLYSMLATFIIDLVGDAVLKTAANTKTWREVPWGIALYAVSAIPWYMAMRTMKLVTFAAVFPVVGCLGVAALGVWGFKEKVSTAEWCALALSLIVVIILGRLR